MFTYLKLTAWDEHTEMSNFLAAEIIQWPTVAVTQVAVYSPVISICVHLYLMHTT